MAKSSKIASPSKKTASKATKPAAAKKTFRKSAPRGAAKKPSTRTRAPKAAAPKQVAPGTPDPGRELAMAIAELGLEKKATDVVVLDVRGLSSYADYFVVMSAESDPQLTAIADHVTGKLKEKGERAIGVEGTQAGQWVLIDFVNVVAHVFYQDQRAFYDLEGLWADAPRIEVKDLPRGR